MQAKLQSKITLFLIKPIYELSETMDIRGPKWALKKKIAARKHATPLGAKLPLSLNPRNAPGTVTVNLLVLLYVTHCLFIVLRVGVLRPHVLCSLFVTFLPFSVAPPTLCSL